MSSSQEEFRERLEVLVKRFDANKKDYLDKDYGESNVRGQLIDPLFAALGWDMDDQIRKLGPKLCEVVREKGDTPGRPDYNFRLNGQTIFFVEAKAPHVELERKEILQAINYARGTPDAVPFAVLTNFREFRLYDASLQPDPKHLEWSMIFKFLYNSYLSEEAMSNFWKLSREQVAAGSLDTLLLQDPASRKRRFPLDEAFLADLTGWRTLLAKNAYKNHPGLDVAALNEAVQVFLDRLIFIRIAEDRFVLPPNQLKRYQEQWSQGERRSLRALLNRHFEAINHELNGEVFKPNPTLDGVTFDDVLIAKIIESLCDGTYDFGTIPVEMLGSIYERYLGKTIRVTTKQVKVEDKPELRKAEGVYYTPRYIVDYIVKITVGKMIADKSPKQLEYFRVLDMACGSGSFLLCAYQYLLDYYLDWYKQHSPQKYPEVVAENGKVWRLTTVERKRILARHIFGVDLDPQAVEITMMSLYIKALEGETKETIATQLKMFNEPALPGLSANIKCGNSLISYDDLRLFAKDSNQLEIIKPFNWNQQFPDAMKRGGFDCVIGNPPYLNIDDTWGKGDDRLKLIKSAYPEIYNDKTDILFYFLAKAVLLSKGLVGFIVSRAFLEAYKADKLRAWLPNHAKIQEIVDFQNYYVFNKVGITTAIVLLSKMEETAPRAWIYQLRSAEFAPNDLSIKKEDARLFKKISVNQKQFSSQSWVFADGKIKKLIQKIDAAGQPLKGILFLGEGMQTGRNSVFGISLEDILLIGKGMETGRNDVFGKLDNSIIKWGLKPGQFFIRARNSDILRYHIQDSGEFLLYLEDFQRFDDLPAKVRNHLKSHEAELKERAAYQRGDCEWWKYTWPLHKQYLQRSKIYCPYLASSNRFALDDKVKALGLTDTTVLFDNDQPENLHYLLGLLNSHLLTFRFKFIGKLKSGGIREYFWNSISKLPIRRINFAKPADKARHDRMVELVKNMIRLNQRLHLAKSTTDRQQYQSLIEATDQEIDQLVYELYGLTKEEIEIIKGEQDALPNT
jgi:type I restriction-modification system DNA methylase subunit